MSLKNKTILLTGGVGSFGKKFVSIALKEHDPYSIRVYDINELGLVEMRRHFKDKRLRFLIGDVRDRNRLKRAMNNVDLVVHAAALKHVDMCEYNPIEAVRTNIEGAMNVVDAAIDNNVAKVINISTDKAAYPVNLYGASKMVAEKLFIQGNTYVSANKETIFSCTRYGNVLGSSGSVIPLFQKQKEQGKIKITDENMTRFWLKIEDGVNFVIKSINMMKGGEIFIPKIKSMKIMDLAEAIAPGVKKEIIGIRPGEKIHEVLLTKEEARHSKAYKDYFVVCPEFSFWKDEKDSGCQLDSSFEYSSDTNEDKLVKEDLKKIIN